MIVWKLMPSEKTGKKEEIPEPQSGIDSDFDEANAIVNEMKDQFKEILITFQKRFSDRRISFSHAKGRFEIEIPEEHVKGNKKPNDLELVSTRQGY